MSPEQCLGQRVGARSDLYSLGVLLYEMLAGRPPFVDPLQSALLVKQATAAPPPLPRLRSDVQRPLALAVHSLLAKRPDDRPRTAGAAKQMLERSLAQHDRTLPDIEPMSSMVAAANPARSILFRIGAPLILVTMFGALLAWGYTGETAPQTGAAAFTSPTANNQPQIAPVAYRNEGLKPVPKPEYALLSADELTMDQARRTAARFARGVLGSVEIVDTDGGQAIIAVSIKRKLGKTSFFVLEKRNDKYQIIAQGALDANGFSHASWSTEQVDADEDGYPEVIFSGKDSEESLVQRRLMLYVPNDNRMYSMLMNGDTTPRGTPRITWLSNAAGTNAAAYRTALRQKAKAIVARR